VRDDLFCITYIERLQERNVFNERFVHFALVEGAPEYDPTKRFPVLCNQ